MKDGGSSAQLGVDDGGASGWSVRDPIYECFVMEMLILPTVGTAARTRACVYKIDLISCNMGESATSSVDVCCIRPGCHGQIQS